MKTTISIKDKVSKPNENYSDAFSIEIDLNIDLPGTLMTDEEYKKVTNAIKTIKRTLAPYREVAARNLRLTPTTGTKK